MGIKHWMDIKKKILVGGEKAKQRVANKCWFIIKCHHVSDLHLATDHRFSSIYNPRLDINGTKWTRDIFSRFSFIRRSLSLSLFLFARRRAANSLPLSQIANTFEGKALRSYSRGYIFQANTMLRPTTIEKLLSRERERDSEFYFETLSVINYIHVSLIMASNRGQKLDQLTRTLAQRESQ